MKERTFYILKLMQENIPDVIESETLIFHFCSVLPAFVVGGADTKASVQGFYLATTVEPRYNKGPRDWQNLFTVTRFHYIKVFSI